VLLTMGLSGTSSLCIFGRPYSRGALVPDGCSCLRRSSVSEDFFSSFMVFRSMDSVGSLSNLAWLHHTDYFQALKMEMIHGSETSANYILTPGKYPKEHIQGGREVTVHRLIRYHDVI